MPAPDEVVAPREIAGTSPASVAAAVQHQTQGQKRARKRAFSGPDQASVQRRKGVKVTRACDTCKKRKSRCSGTLPCDSCRKRGRSADCHYDAEYRRGQAVPPIHISFLEGFGDHNSERNLCQEMRQDASQDRELAGSSRSDMSIETEPLLDRIEASLSTIDVDTLPEQDTVAPSRASPELGVAEIQGQYFDTTSGLAFVHRAFRRLSKGGTGHTTRPLPELAGDVENEDSPTLTVGDKPMDVVRQGHFELPSLSRARELVHLYFDVCIATYRFLHLQTVEDWLQVVLRNKHDGIPIFHGLGRARAAIVLTILAIATAHDENASGRFQEDEASSMNRIDSLFSTASALIQQETARPTLESAQARIIQVLYLLTTSRMNQAWYTFGTAIQLISALGLHRKSGKKCLNAATDDYIVAQCRRRTFWTAYILDKYLGVIFGRPRHYNDDEIDQEMPDSVNDEDMTPSGPKKEQRRGRKDCHIDALIYHTQIASILSEAARTVYSIKEIPRQDRIAAANRLSEELRKWRISLPPHLGSIAPSSLIPRFRRQATTLKIAYSHATMHVNRLFLLGRISAESETQIREAILAANTVLETIDEMVTEGGTIFHAFWWSHYVTFCALAVVYAWEIQARKTRIDIFPDHAIDQSDLLDLAERCQRHLAEATASNSPSRRYALILDKLRREVIRNLKNDQITDVHGHSMNNRSPNANIQGRPAVPQMVELRSQDQSNGLGLGELSPQGGFGPPLDSMNWSIQDWQSEDWLNLDSMAFGTFPDSHDSPFTWDGIENNG
ncbi:putative Fungal-specific transcription factor domain-containing protein [Seiridium unicorne]|uniref:Fungal-specific transcription factor domain-containing protein n=1 Tax=Seiridium unicorne TaxID=138068 RepID=A0ABR2UUS4_9PEZI